VAIRKLRPGQGLRRQAGPLLSRKAAKNAVRASGLGAPWARRNGWKDFSDYSPEFCRHGSE
jgi:hypothetical protein